MRNNQRSFGIVAMVALSVFSVATPVRAQLADASAATLGVGGNATAVARGISAIALNPAGLGMPGAGFTLAIIPVQIRTGLAPVGLKDLKDVEGTVISTATKEDWLSRAVAEGSQRGSVCADLAEFAVTFGNVGLEVSTLAGGSVDLAPEVLELMLYGNAGRTGQPADLTFGSSSLNGFAATTFGASFGVPLSTSEGSMALGATLKYTVGHALAVGRSQGGGLQSNPLRVDVDFPVITIDDNDVPLNAGSGVGLDVGFQMQRDRLSIGAAVQNLFNTFSWDETKLFYRPGTVLLEQGDNSTDFDKQPYANAPSALRQVVDDMKFNPVVAVGAGYDVSEDFTVTADFRNRFGDGIDIGPKLHVGAGAEYRGLKVLHLRAGGAVVTDGALFGGGASLILGPVNLSFAGAMQSSSKAGDTTIGQFTLSFGGN